MEEETIQQAKAFLAALDRLTDAMESEGPQTPFFALLDGIRDTRYQVATVLETLGFEEPYGGWRDG